MAHFAIDSERVSHPSRDTSISRAITTWITWIGRLSHVVDRGVSCSWMFSLVGVCLDLFLFRRLTVTVHNAEWGVLAGETLEGVVELSLEKVVSSAGLKLVVSGYEQMEWHETDSEGASTSYSSRIEHLHLESEIEHLGWYRDTGTTTNTNNNTGTTASSSLLNSIRSGPTNRSSSSSSTSTTSTSSSTSSARRSTRGPRLITSPPTPTSPPTTMLSDEKVAAAAYDAAAAAAAPTTTTSAFTTTTTTTTTSGTDALPLPLPIIIDRLHSSTSDTERKGSRDSEQHDTSVDLNSHQHAMMMNADGGSATPLSDSSANHEADEVAKTEQLSIGTYRIPFSFSLPQSMLPSYRAKYSRMVYEIRATVMIRSWVSPNIRAQCEFRVLGTPISTWRSITARSFPGAVETLRKSFWFDNGHILLRVQTCKVLYIPGERLALHVVVENRSSVDVRSIRVQLRREVLESGTVSGVTKTVDRRQFLGTREWTWPVAAGKAMTRDLLYRVPSGIVATLAGRLLRVSYRLVVELLHPLRLPTHCEVPIIIAPAKLMDLHHHHQQAPSPQQAPPPSLPSSPPISTLAKL